jgi:hypothetical protein
MSRNTRSLMHNDIARLALAALALFLVATAAAAQPAPRAERMLVTGRVLDPAGKPVPNATVTASLRRKLRFAPMGSEGVFPTPVGDATSDGSGRFRLDAPRASSSQHAEFGITAVAPGYGVGWAELDPDEDQPTADITLQPEQVIEGRVVDAQGQPVPGVSVSVWAVLRVLPVPPLRTAGGQFLDILEGPRRWSGRINDLPGWPRPATTDANGYFALHGIGRGLRVSLIVLDPRFAPQTFEAATDAADAKPLKVTLQPARTLTGRVTYADTGKPVAHAEVHVGAGDGPGGVRQGGVRFLATEADAEGRFRVPVTPGDRPHVWAAAPGGQPYLHAGQTLAWPREATEQAVALALPRGVLIRGKVTEEGTGQPVADAMVSFSLARPGGGWALTKPDGSFAMVIGTGAQPGHLTVQAPGEDYRLQAISGARLSAGNVPGFRHYAHAFLPYDPKPGAEPPEIRVALRRGATVRFRLIGPNGEPVRDVRVYSRAVLGPTAASADRMWWPATFEVARRGDFEVHGLDPDTEIPVHFLQPESKLGATARISGKMAAQGPVTVRLEPCGTAMARLVGPDGQPVTGQPRGLSVTMAITPGPPTGAAPLRTGGLAADEAALSRIDPVNHANPLVADVQGRITLPALIPGATYRIIDRSAVAAPDVGEGPQIRREFTVGPGEAIELGDVLIAGPQRRN